MFVIGREISRGSPAVPKWMPVPPGTQRYGATRCGLLLGRRGTLTPLGQRATFTGFRSGLSSLVNRV